MIVLNKRILSILILLLVTTALFSQGSPKLVFKEVQANLGPQIAGKTIQHAFKFKNLGSAPLVIKGVRVSCGCLSATYPDEPVLPGQSGEVTVKYNSTGHFGIFYKSYIVSSNDTAHYNTELGITGKLIFPDFEKENQKRELEKQRKQDSIQNIKPITPTKKSKKSTPK
jgi:hypothetical protein